MSVELNLPTIIKGRSIPNPDHETVTSFIDLSTIQNHKLPPLSSNLDRNDLETIVSYEISSPPTSLNRKDQEGFEIPENSSPPTSHTRKEQEGYKIPENSSPPKSHTRKDQEGYEIPENSSPPKSHTRKVQEGYETPENTRDCPELVFESDNVDISYINCEIDDYDSDGWSVRSCHSNQNYSQDRFNSENSRLQKDYKNKEHTKSTKPSNERNPKKQNSNSDTGEYTQVEADEYFPQYTKNLTGVWKRHPTSILLKTAFILMVLDICMLIYIRLYAKDQQNFDDDKIRVPCEALRDFYPVASLYMFNDDITNQRFEAAGIRKVKDKENNISCEVNFTSIMLRMSRDEYNVVEGQVRLKADKKGPTLEYSSYNLSVTQADLRGVSHDPQALIIQMEGDYFVYFGIELVYGPHNSCRKLHFQTSIIHLLIQENSIHYPRALMASEHTCCVTCDTETTTEFTGGLFHFKENDRLFMQVSSPQNVGTSGANFLGVFRMRPD